MRDAADVLTDAALELDAWGTRPNDGPEVPSARGCDSCNAPVQDRCDGCDSWQCSDCLTQVSHYVLLCPDCIGGAR